MSSKVRAADDFDAIRAAMKDKKSVALLPTAAGTPEFKEGGHVIEKITMSTLRKMTLTYDDTGRQYKIGMKNGIEVLLEIEAQ